MILYRNKSSRLDQRTVKTNKKKKFSKAVEYNINIQKSAVLPNTNNEISEKK